MGTVLGTVVLTQVKSTLIVGSTLALSLEALAMAAVDAGPKSDSFADLKI